MMIRGVVESSGLVRICIRCPRIHQFNASSSSHASQWRSVPLSSPSQSYGYSRRSFATSDVAFFPESEAERFGLGLSPRAQGSPQRPQPQARYARGRNERFSQEGKSAVPSSSRKPPGRTSKDPLDSQGPRRPSPLGDGPRASLDGPDSALRGIQPGSGLPAHRPGHDRSQPNSAQVGQRDPANRSGDPSYANDTRTGRSSGSDPGLMKRVEKSSPRLPFTRASESGLTKSLNNKESIRRTVKERSPPAVRLDGLAGELMLRGMASDTLAEALNTSEEHYTHRHLGRKVDFSNMPRQPKFKDGQKNVLTPSS
ncbi:hypothetical protein BD324DRAFT_349311 [Kockovaella imperatae]|uniref:Uncharacterized protein n=1 Tax=Kockovaella imperatae TaxID=4999 RepID=A0A1Y1UL92_9TREE|nr:hypothetical protein BD324DRAFT_349311 [Kockovaella imperatae]ORX38327.1 hypothetical protein BD324DRAFT_349311 [Kockovaella imperatae]